MPRRKYWESKKALHTATKGRMNITYYLADKQASDRVKKPLSDINHELRIANTAIETFKR